MSFCLFGMSRRGWDEFSLMEIRLFSALMPSLTQMSPAPVQCLFRLMEEFVKALLASLALILLPQHTQALWSWFVLFCFLTRFVLSPVFLFISFQYADTQML